MSNLKGSRTEENLKAAFAGESQANRRYLYFAQKADVEGQSPVQVISAADIEATGLGSIGDVIQRLSVSGSSLNTKFNSAGNFGGGMWNDTRRSSSGCPPSTL